MNKKYIIAAIICFIIIGFLGWLIVLSDEAQEKKEREKIKFSFFFYIFWLIIFLVLFSKFCAFMLCLCSLLNFIEPLVQSVCPININQLPKAFCSLADNSSIRAVAKRKAVNVNI